MDELELLEAEARRLLDDPARYMERLRAIQAQRTKLEQETQMKTDGERLDELLNMVEQRISLVQEESAAQLRKRQREAEEYWANGGPNRQQQSVDVDRLTRQYERLAVEMQELNRASGAEATMAFVAKQMSEIETQLQEHDKRAYEAYLQSFSGELSQLDTDIENIIGGMNGNVSNSELEALAKQLERRETRKAQIEAGEAFNLSWTPPRTE